MHIYKLNIHQIECIIIHSYIISFNRKISKILNQPKIFSLNFLNICNYLKHQELKILIIFLLFTSEKSLTKHFTTGEKM